MIFLTPSVGIFQVFSCVYPLKMNSLSQCCSLVVEVRRYIISSELEQVLAALTRSERYIVLLW